MVSLSKDATISDYSKFIQLVYGMQNDRFYTIWDMLDNVQRFSMRCVKGVRKEDKNKTRINALICLSWYMSLMNRLHINVDDSIWHRFPYLCSYCGECPCACKAEKVKTRRKVTGNSSSMPKRIKDIQEMFMEIYPTKARTKGDAAIHLAEETGELSEAVHIYMGDRSDMHFQKVSTEAADYFSCLMGVLNSISIDTGNEIAKLFSNNCHECHHMPCICTYEHVCNYRS